MKVVIEIKNGVVFGISSDEPIDVHIVDYDTEGLDRESLINYAEGILIPTECTGGCDPCMVNAGRIFLRIFENKKL